VLKLTLLRHAKSCWENPALADRVRPLNARGYRQGSRLALLFPKDVEQIWCSPSVRTYTTAQLLCMARPGLQERLRLEVKLYNASCKELQSLLAKADGIRHLALIGHNPGLELLAGWLTDSQVHMKTAHLAQLLVDCADWQHLRPGSARLLSLERPEIP